MPSTTLAGTIHIRPPRCRSAPTPAAAGQSAIGRRGSRVRCARPAAKCSSAARSPATDAAAPHLEPVVATDAADLAEEEDHLGRKVVDQIPRQEQGIGGTAFRRVSGWVCCGAGLAIARATHCLYDAREAGERDHVVRGQRALLKIDCSGDAWMFAAAKRLRSRWRAAGCVVVGPHTPDVPGAAARGRASRGSLRSPSRCSRWPGFARHSTDGDTTHGFCTRF